MTALRALRRLAERLGGGLRRMTGRPADLDYRRCYARCDLQRDHWSIVGPKTKEEYDRLSAVKLQMLIDLGLTPDAKILDVGCGTGLLTAALHEYLSERGLYRGADISPDAIAFCRQRFRRANFSFHVSDMTVLPELSERFDVIVFFSVFTHTYPRETAALLRQAGQLLADEGMIFADVFTAPHLVEHQGTRAAVAINPDYLMPLLEGSGLCAKEVEIQSRPTSGQRIFYRFTIVE